LVIQMRNCGKYLKGLGRKSHLRAILTD